MLCCAWCQMTSTLYQEVKTKPWLCSTAGQGSSCRKFRYETRNKIINDTILTSSCYSLVPLSLFLVPLCLQLSSYLLSVCYSGREVWAGDNRGLVHSFSMHNSRLTPISHFNIHRSLVTGVHSSPGTLYTCSSDRTIKVSPPTVTNMFYWHLSKVIGSPHLLFPAGPPPMCSTTDTVHPSPSGRS